MLACNRAYLVVVIEYHQVKVGWARCAKLWLIPGVLTVQKIVPVTSRRYKTGRIPARRETGLWLHPLRIGMLPRRASQIWASSGGASRSLPGRVLKQRDPVAVTQAGRATQLPPLLLVLLSRCNGRQRQRA